MSRFDKSEYGGFDKSVLRPGDSRCILKVKPSGKGKGPYKPSSPFTNAPIQTGGFGGGYGAAEPRWEISSRWQLGEDLKKPRRRRTW